MRIINGTIFIARITRNCALGMISVRLGILGFYVRNVIMLKDSIDKLIINVRIALKDILLIPLLF